MVAAVRLYYASTFNSVVSVTVQMFDKNGNITNNANLAT